TPSQRESIPYREFERGVLQAVTKLKARDVDGRHEADALTVRAHALQEERARLGVELEALDGQMRELPPERWPRRVVARIAELEDAVRQKDVELRAAKQAANTSGRTEALEALRTCIQLLDEVRRDRPEEEPVVCRRIKTRLPLILDSIWVKVQMIHKRSRYVHVR